MSEAPATYDVNPVFELRRFDRHAEAEAVTALLEAAFTVKTALRSALPYSGLTISETESAATAIEAALRFFTGPRAEAPLAPSSWTAPNLTPEERARAVASAILVDPWPESIDTITAALRAAKMDGYRENIAQTEEAIRLAVAAETERCARVAEEWGRGLAHSTRYEEGGEIAFNACGGRIARTIRTRTAEGGGK